MSTFRTAMLAFLVGAPVAGHGQEEFMLEEPTQPPPDPERVAELTEIRNTTEWGLLYVDDDSFRFGRYTGLKEEGVYGVIDVDWQRRDAYDSADPHYCRVSADRLGLESREAAVECGAAGDWRVRVDYDQTPTYRSDTSSTIYPLGSAANLSLPAGWVAGPSTLEMTELLPSLGAVDFRHERRRVGVTAEKILARRWELSASFSRDEKDGRKTFGAVMGNSGGNPRSVLLPEPIDYESDSFDVALRFNDPRRQFEARYHGSIFRNARTGVAWQNPYAAIAGWDPAAGFPGAAGQFALPPDNEFHQLSIAAGYDWSERTRVSADLALGRMTQDDRFLPYTMIPALAATITQPLPRDSLDGEIGTTVANLRLSSRPFDRFHWNLLLRYDERDNNTPRDEYVYIGGDSQAQDTSETSSRRRFNEPYSYRETKLRADAGYRLGSAARLTAAAEHREIDRTFSERETATEDTVSIAMASTLSQWNLMLRSSRSDRSGSTYIGEEPFLSGYSPGFTGTVPGGWENAPGLRKFHLANRTRDQLGASVTWTPAEAWSIGIDLQHLRDDYDRSELGLTRSTIGLYTLDLTYAPAAAWSTHAFYTWERLKSDQDGRSITGFNRVADAVNPERTWRALHRDRGYAAGAGLAWEAIEERLELGLDYVVADSASDVDVNVGTELTAAPLPEVESRLRTLSFYGHYRLRRNVALKLRFWNEQYDSADYALDGVEANQLANVILLGEDSADHDINAVALSVSHRF